MSSSAVRGGNDALPIPRDFEPEPDCNPRTIVIVTDEERDDVVQQLQAAEARVRIAAGRGHLFR